MTTPPVGDFIAQALEDAERRACDGRPEDRPDHEGEIAELRELVLLLWESVPALDRLQIAQTWDPMGERESAGEIVAAWTKLPEVKVPACDLCPRPAAFHHPNLGRRCVACPKPTPAATAQATERARKARRERKA